MWVCVPLSYTQSGAGSSCSTAILEPLIQMSDGTPYLLTLQTTSNKMIVMRGKEQMDRGMVKEIPESLVR